MTDLGDAAKYLGQRTMQMALYDKLKRRFSTISRKGWELHRVLPLRGDPHHLINHQPLSPPRSVFLVTPERRGLATSSVAAPSPTLTQRSPSSGVARALQVSMSIGARDGASVSGIGAPVDLVPLSSGSGSAAPGYTPWASGRSSQT